MRNQITQSIALYKSGELQKCLAILEPLSQSAQAKSAHAYFRANAIPPDPLACYQWITLAVDRLHQELGADVIAVMPVLLSLNTALSLCKT